MHFPGGGFWDTFLFINLKNSTCGQKNGGKLTDGKSHGGKPKIRLFPLCKAACAEEPDAAHPGKLLRKLGKSRHQCLFSSIEIAVDTGMYGAHGNGKGEDAQHIGSSWLLQEAQGDKIRCLTDKDSTQAGQGNGDKKACPEGGGGGFFIPGSFFSDDLGDGSLVAGGSQGEGEGQDRAKELIDAHAFLPEAAGEVNSIEKADGPADKSCKG